METLRAIAKRMKGYAVICQKCNKPISRYHMLGGRFIPTLGGFYHMTKKCKYDVREEEDGRTNETT